MSLLCFKVDLSWQDKPDHLNILKLFLLKANIYKQKVAVALYVCMDVVTSAYKHVYNGSAFAMLINKVEYYQIMLNQKNFFPSN